MIDKLIAWSIQWRFFVVLLVLALIGAGIYAAIGLPIDAVPDVTTNQVQINTVAPAFTPLEMEQYVTSPIEVAMSSLPHKEAIRSLSQFGLSQVTIVFPDDADLYAVRQLVLERLHDVERDLPPGVAPELAPISTGLGEIYQFTVEDVSGKGRYSLMERRTLLDWFIKPQLRAVPGVIEVNSFGGKEQQYEVLVDPAKLIGYGLTLRQVIDALSANNINTGGGYLEHGGEQELIRGVGLIRNEADIGNIVVSSHQGTPVYVSSVAEVGRGAQIRQGAATRDGKGETVMGVAMLLKGENSRAVAGRIAERLQQVQKALPPGVKIEPFYDRSTLVDRTIRTATRNLIEGGLVVMAVLFLFLLQFRAGLIVSSAIPLAMLVAIIGMRYFGISANLMSLGAIDFGLIVDAAVIIVENCVRRLAEKRRELGRALTGNERRSTVREASVEVRKAGQVGEILIIAAYLPIVSLVGIEGKMFRPMAFTVIFALSGALVLSLTLIPALSALLLREPRRVPKGRKAEAPSLEADNPIIHFIARFYASLLRGAIRHRRLTALGALLFVIACLALYPYLGAEFLPKLDEGALAINVNRLPSVSLSEAVRMSSALEKVVREFPETDTVVSRIGRPEIATDPMGPNMGDTYVFLKPITEWKSAARREELVSKMDERLKASVPTQAYSFSQPIEFRMQELIEGIGARSDVVIKIFGDDLDTLREQAGQTARILSKVPGAADVKVEQTSGQPVLQVNIDRAAIARYGINVADVQLVIQTAIAGTEATRVLEGFRRFELVVRLMPEVRQNARDFANLLVSAPNGQRIPLAQLAHIGTETGPVEIARENGQRRISVEANVRGHDIGSFVQQAQADVARNMQLPPGYIMEWGGLWQNLESGRNRLLIVVPVTFLIIFMLLFATFHSARLATLVFTGVPFAVTGGILALLLRGMPFSMSAGVGFIAVSGVAVLNGLVLVAFIGRFHQQGESLETAVYQGTLLRLRPVLMTAAVASLGFLPMALSTSAGAEVQRPLATVVIGGIITSTFLTLLVLPALYPWFGQVLEEPGSRV
ncbi:MAG TPA: CusA/CzcA family heavy metal efflux RND transporter [Candidatus Dormibacteraeota bacterium]|nr:CusA/CzcA family heavy metal efflux RND transporter [Candidatus Dormibacteraeota bacterium]